MGAHCLTRNVTEEGSADYWISAAESLGGAHGGNYQHGRAARGSVGGGGASLVGRAGREGSTSLTRCAGPRAGIASTRSGRYGSASSQLRPESRVSAAAATARHQRRAHSIVGSVGSRVRQAARGDDSDPSASTGATWPIAAQRRRAWAIACERRNDRSNARRREGGGSGWPSPTGGLLRRDPS
jgi:hypothetical protein